MGKCQNQLSVGVACMPVRVNVRVTDCRVYDRSTFRMESIVVFVPGDRDQLVTIERCFRDTSTGDERWGFYLLMRMGRLCVNSELWIKVIVAKSNEVLSSCVKSNY